MSVILYPPCHSRSRTDLNFLRNLRFHQHRYGQMDLEPQTGTKWSWNLGFVSWLMNHSLWTLELVRNVEVYHPDVPQTGDIGKFQVGCCVVGRFLGCGGLYVQMATLWTWGSMSFFGTMYTAWIYRHLMQATFQKLQGWVFLTEETCDFHLQSYMAMQNDYLPHIGEGFGGPFLTMTQTQSQELQRAAQKLITGRSRAEVSRKALCIGIYRHTCTCINCVNTYIKLYLLKPKKLWIIVWCNRESLFGVMWYVQHLLTSPVVVF